ncbi:hypothetical protein ACVIQT_005952 [Bradyrhizobium diazoefficiens]
MQEALGRLEHAMSPADIGSFNYEANPFRPASAPDVLPPFDRDGKRLGQMLLT